MSPTATPPASTSAQALQNLQSFQGSEQSPQALLQSQEQQLGVPQAQQQVSGLQSAIQNTTNLLNQVAPSVYGNTQNSLVTDAQANQQIGNREAPLNTTLSTENTQEGNAANNFNYLTGQASTLAGLEAQGQQSQEGYLQNIYSDLASQEQQDQANQLAQEQLAASERASSAADVASPSLASLLGTSGLGGSNATYGLKVANNPGSGYYFRDANGNPINALQYANATGVSLQSIVQKMAASGDTGAKEILPLVSGNTIANPQSSGYGGNTNLASIIKDFTG